MNHVQRSAPTLAAAWTLARATETGAQPEELDQFMPAHQRRVTGLMEMHREMVQGRNR